MAIIRKMLPKVLIDRITTVLNNFIKGETIEDSKKKWNTLADKNANYFVLTTFGEKITESQFTNSGKEDYQTIIEDDPILSSLNPFQNKRVLEIGCGTGRITEFLAKNFGEVHGIDISDGMIANAKQRLIEYKNTTLQATNGTYIPYSDEFFDFVFSFIVFQHMPSKGVVRKNVEESIRVLKSGGIGKIQLRGTPVLKSSWFYGPYFTKSGVLKLFNKLPVEIIKIEGEGRRYFWVWFQKK